MQSHSSLRKSRRIAEIEAGEEEFYHFLLFQIKSMPLSCRYFPVFPLFAAIAKEVTNWKLNDGCKVPFHGIA